MEQCNCTGLDYVVMNVSIASAGSAAEGEMPTNFQQYLAHVCDASQPSTAWHCGGRRKNLCARRPCCCPAKVLVVPGPPFVHQPVHARQFYIEGDRCHGKQRPARNSCFHASSNSLPLLFVALLKTNKEKKNVSGSSSRSCT